MNDQTVLLPLYDVATGNGSSGKYYIKGFAAFHVTGYHFASNSWTSGGTIKNKTIRGYFVRYVSLVRRLRTRRGTGLRDLSSPPNHWSTLI